MTYLSFQKKKNLAELLCFSNFGIFPTFDLVPLENMCCE